MKKYNIKDLVKNTDFEAQRRDPELKAWNEKSLLECEDLDAWLDGEDEKVQTRDLYFLFN